MAKSITLAETTCGVLYTYTVTQTGVSDSLNGNITDAATTITLNDSSAFSATGKVRIGEEIISYTGNSSNQLTGCTRGIENSTAAAHTSADSVYQVTTAWSSNLNNTAAFDYFADNADVGSCLYFAETIFYTPDSSGLVLNVGTAISATSITLKWEGGKGNTLKTWGELPDLVDGTNVFTNTGVNRVKWHLPIWWKPTNVNGIKMSGYDPIWGRVRITAVSGLTEGGANQTDTVKNIAGKIVISGGTSGDPITIENIYDANVTGNWYAITRIASGGDYSLGINIYFVWGFTIYLSGGCVFKSTNEVIFFLSGYVEGDNNASNLVQFGEEHVANYLGKKGSVVMMGGYGYNTEVYWNGIYNVKFYDSVLLINGNSLVNYGLNLDLIQSMFMKPADANGASIFYGGGTVNFKNSNTMITPITYTSPATYTYNFDNSYLLGLSPYRNSPGYMARELSAVNIHNEYDTKVILFDCSISNIAFGYLAGAVAGDLSEYYIHNSLSLTVIKGDGTAISGATVHIVDKNGNTPQKWSGDLFTGGLVNIGDLTTDANGLISTDLHRRYYWWAKDTGLYTDDIYTPFTVTISKAGYQTKTIIYDMTQKRVEVEVLEPSIINIDQESL